jgi:uncharacterized Zn finger protein
MCKPQKIKNLLKKNISKNITKIMKSTNETQAKKKKENLHMLDK